jgi:pimeloyl-ACP methyl ester carboxylesterase
MTHAPFDVAWRTIDGLEIRYATSGAGGETIVLFSPWPESIFAFVPIWAGLARQFQVLAIDLPGFGRSEGRDDLFSPKQMGGFITNTLTPLRRTRASKAFPQPRRGRRRRHGYAVPQFVRDDYLASYEGDRLTRSAGLVRAYPTDLAALAPRLASIHVPVAIVVGRNDPYGLARDAALLRERLPHARLDVLDAGHCVWEERAPEFEAIVTHWIGDRYRA